MIPLIYILTLVSLLLHLATCIQAARHRTSHARCLMATAWTTTAALFVVNWGLSQAPPFGNMRHVLCFFPLVLAPACVYLHHFRNYNLTASFSAAAALSLIGALCMPIQATWRQMPALQSPWFAPHVTSYVIAYGLLTVSSLLVLRSFIKHAPTHLDAASEVVRLSFPFLTFGLWSGAIWADDAWARYWAWDIKEVWSLITWLIYVFYFHIEHNKLFSHWRRPLLLLGFACVLITFFVVNLLPQISSLHSYASVGN